MRRKNRKKPRAFAPRPRRSLQRAARAPSSFAPRPRRSPQRVARTPQESQKTSSFCTSTTPIPAEGRADAARIAENLECWHLHRADPRRGSQSRSTIKVLPWRPRIAARAEALRTWLYALGCMHLAPTHLALCTRLCALGSAHLALCTRLCALGSVHSALCTWLYALGSMLSALRTWVYALGSMLSALCTRLYMHLALCTWLCALGSICTWLYALGSAHSALCTWLYLHLALFALGSICTWLYALGSMHGSMRLAPCTWLYVFDSAQVTLCKLVRELLAESIFPQALFQPRRRLFTSMRRACLYAAKLSQCVWSHESSISSSYERKHGSVCASCSVPGCCVQVALCKLLHASGSTSVFKLFCARCSVQVSLRRKTLGACICAQDAQPELSCGGAPRTIRLRFRGAIFRLEPPGVHSTYYGFFA